MEAATGLRIRVFATMSNMAESPSDIPARAAERPEASATQLTILLSAATSTIDEEFKRSERLDAKSRNQITVTAAFFAVVQAVVVNLIDGALGPHGSHPRSSFVTWLAITGAVAGAALVFAAFVSYHSWKLRDDPALGLGTIRNYLDAARQGNPAVGAKLVEGYATIAEGRRENNERRAIALDRAGWACALTMLFIGIELVLAFVAVAIR
jgi:hypothetical protein